MPNRQEIYTATRTSKENCTERMQPSGTIRYASDSAEIKPAQRCIKLVFYLTYTMMRGNTKLKTADIF
jgi:hypothetical protein